MIAATMKYLAPPINIFQYYEAYKPMVLKCSGLPDIRNKSHLSRDEVQGLWAKANSEAKDLLTFMWILKDVIIPRGVVEVFTTNPPFYLIRLCISTLTHITPYH